jgi:hypothetical protein
MGVMLRGLPALAGLAVLAGTSAELAGHRAFTRLVRRDTQVLQARSAPTRAGVVTEQMPAGLPDPVRRYVRYAGVAGKPLPRTIRLHQKGKMRPGPGQPWMPLTQTPRTSIGCSRPACLGCCTALGPLAVGRAGDMYTGGTGRMLVKVASLWPVADASGGRVDRNGMTHYRPRRQRPGQVVRPDHELRQVRRAEASRRGPAIWKLSRRGYGGIMSASR